MILLRVGLHVVEFVAIGGIFSILNVSPTLVAQQQSISILGDAKGGIANALLGVIQDGADIFPLQTGRNFESTELGGGGVQV